MAEQQLSIEERIEAALAPPPAPEQTPEQSMEAPQEAPQDVLTDAPGEPSELIAEDAAPTTDEQTPEPETEATEEVAAEPDEAVALTSLNDLAEHLGVETSELYKLSIPVTDVNTGERAEVSLGEYKDAFTTQARASRAEAAAREAKEALDADRAKFSQEVEKTAQEGAAMLNAVDEQLMAEYKAVNWEQLKVTDPTQWAIKRQEFNDRQAAVNNIRQTAAAEYQARMEEAKNHQAQQLQEVVEREHAALLTALPTWRDSDTRQTEQGQLREYLLSSGYSDQEVEQAYDHRIIVIAHKAMQFDAMQKNGKAATKKVVKIGKKVLTPGAQKTKAAATQDAETALRKNLKKTGSVDAAAALISHRLNNRS